MADKIEATALTDFVVESEGTHLRLNMRDRDGRPASLTLPTECVNQLLMTLPEMARQALRAQYGDHTLRLVYPVGGWSVERAGEEHRMILTMRTVDGFEVSFSLDRLDVAELGEAMAGGSREVFPAARLN